MAVRHSFLACIAGVCGDGAPPRLGGAQPGPHTVWAGHSPASTRFPITYVFLIPTDLAWVKRYR